MTMRAAVPGEGGYIYAGHFPFIGLSLNLIINVHIMFLHIVGGIKMVTFPLNGNERPFHATKNGNGMEGGSRQ